MWGEGASDLWGRLERDEDEREAELREALRARLRRASGEDDEDDPGDPAMQSLEAA